MFDRQIQDIQSHFVSAVDEFERVGGKRVVSTRLPASVLRINHCMLETRRSIRRPGGL